MMRSLLRRPLRNGLALLAVLLPLWLLPALAEAQPARQLITRGKNAYENADFARALESFREALVRPDVTRAEVIETYRYIASSHIALGNLDEARKALRRLVSLEPTFRFPPGTAPKIVQLLEDVRRTAARVEHLPQRDLQPGPPVTLRARISPPPTDARVVVYVRYSAEGTFTPVPMQAVTDSPTLFHATLPAPPAGAQLEGGSVGIEYYIAVEGGGGESLGGVGDPTQPVRMVVTVRTARVVVTPTDEPTPWYRRWWPWTVAGVLVAGGVVAAVLATRNGGEAPVMGPTQQATIRFNLRGLP